MNQAFWKGRRVFLTGHTGFKGSWLALLLQRLGASVFGYALPPQTTPSLFADAHVAGGMVSRFGDIRDTDGLNTALAEASPDVVLHLAAQAIVSESYDKPLDTLHTNIIGTANLLEALRKQPAVKAAVIVTSDKCYDNHFHAACTEDDALGGKDPYSASKACAEILTACWRQSFFDTSAQPVIATARAGNVIGGGDWSRDRLVPDIVRAFMRNESAQLRSPDSIRPWQHVLEPLSGYLLLAERCATDHQFGQAWNFGPSQADVRPVRHVADALAETWGANARWQQQGRNPVKEAHVLKLDSSKARSMLHWQPVTNLAEGLRLTSQWYKDFAGGAAPRQLCEAQIDSFLAAAARRT